MLLVTGPSRTLGTESPSRIRFGEKPTVAGAPVGRRLLLLLLDEEPATSRPAA